MQKLTPRTIALALEYHLFKKDKALLKPLVPHKVQAMLRRRARAKYLVWDAKLYNEWLEAHLKLRSVKYVAPLEPGLLSIATPVWDGTPLNYLQLLAQSIAVQNASGACEWFVLDNGCTKREIRHYLDRMAAKFPWVTLHREEKNEGIVGGLRVCLESASGRYMCVVDSDDLIYPDCLQIVQWWIKNSGFPPLLYSDEDKLIGASRVQPYFKPDFDPVLLLNSAYIAHLGVIEREKALQLGAYTDRATEGSADWDCFVRFYCAGHSAVHIPEIIYSWRMHPESTADDADSKPYIHSSQKAVLNRYLDAQKLTERFEVKYSPLLPGTSDWWIERKHVGQARVVVVDGGTVQQVAELDCDLICLLLDNLTPERTDYLWEAQGLFERFPDAVMVGGWMADPNGRVSDGPLVLGFDSGCDCPDKGRPVVDPGYFTQMRKQRSVSAISSRFCVIRKTFLCEALSQAGIPLRTELYELGPWLGKWAKDNGWRVIFSPFLRSLDHRNRSNDSTFQGQEFDHRYYPQYFGITHGAAYKLKLGQ